MLAILWFLWLLFSIYLIFEFVGMSGLVSMFPEGRRWWHLPSQLLSIGHFAIVVLFHPFGG
tara:strand:+ start:2656 stop:2838 length:183 start_codon:yes stop_codon:yes gene_type:complete